jgi:hypothetical protein
LLSRGGAADTKSELEADEAATGVPTVGREEREEREEWLIKGLDRVFASLASVNIFSLSLKFSTRVVRAAMVVCVSASEVRWVREVETSCS